MMAGKHRTSRELGAPVWLALAVLLAVVAGGRPAWAQVQAPGLDEGAARCASMQGADFSQIPDAPTGIIGVGVVGAAGDVPAFCNIKGYIVPNVGFEIDLPLASWNGKFLYLGCGAQCGSTITIAGCDGPVRRGYACIVSDMGHKSSALDGKWALGNLQAQVDFAFRATHVATLAGKAITRRFYDRDPLRAYYLGCSTGGRQGMMEAEKFPYDFDGVVVGAPVISQTGDGLAMLWSASAMLGADGRSLFTADDFVRLHKAAVAACDMDDGLKDGIIGDPRTCGFDPAVLQCKGAKTAECFSPEQVAAVRKVYQGPVDSAGRKLYTSRLLPGSELSWFGELVARDGGRGVVDGMVLGLLKLRTIGADLSPLPAKFDWDRDAKRLFLTEALYGASDPDLRKFKGNGGKLIAFTGWSDQEVYPENLVDYYDLATRAMGGPDQTRDFFRLFALPGVYHCGNGEGADKVDYLAALEAWREQGKAPERLLAAHETDAVIWPTDSNYWAFRPIDPKRITFTRPVYPYPIQVRYRGSGDPNDAANFVPVQPKP